MRHSTSSSTRLVIFEGLPEPSLRNIVLVLINRLMKRAIVCQVVTMFSTFSADSI